MSPDIYPPDVRSRVMSRVRARDTKPELLLRRALFALGVRGWRCHRRDLPGTPGRGLCPARLAVFVDGGFWHGHPDRYRPGKSGPYWDAKIARNVQRDRETNEALQAQGWKVIRLWDFEVLREPRLAAARVQRAACTAEAVDLSTPKRGPACSRSLPERALADGVPWHRGNRGTGAVPDRAAAPPSTPRTTRRPASRPRPRSSGSRRSPKRRSRPAAPAPGTCSPPCPRSARPSARPAEGRGRRRRSAGSRRRLPASHDPVEAADERIALAL